VRLIDVRAQADLAVFGSFWIPVALIGFGLTGNFKSVNFIAPISASAAAVAWLTRAVFSACFSVGVAPVFNAVLSYLGQAYAGHAARCVSATHELSLIEQRVREQRLPSLHVRRRCVSCAARVELTRPQASRCSPERCASRLDKAYLTSQVRAPRRHRRVVLARWFGSLLHPDPCVRPALSLADISSDPAAPLRPPPARALQPHGLISIACVTVAAWRADGAQRERL